jgi:hypothetical protein
VLRAPARQLLLRAHGSADARRHVVYYSCLDRKRRGDAVCPNAVAPRCSFSDFRPYSWALKSGTQRPVSVWRRSTQPTNSTGYHKLRWPTSRGPHTWAAPCFGPYVTRAQPKTGGARPVHWLAEGQAGASGIAGYGLPIEERDRERFIESRVSPE